MGCLIFHDWIEEPISNLGQQLRRCRKCGKVQVRYHKLKKGSNKWIPKEGWKNS